MHTTKDTCTSLTLTRHAKGFTLLECMIVTAIIGILAGIAIPSYLSSKERTRTTIVITDIKRIEADILLFFSENGIFPPDLAAIGRDSLQDPWGNPYDYWPITGDKNQQVRKDRNVHPINTDFDLYSRGKDGKTNFPLTAHSSQDDIIRANNGSYVGLASNY